jgi:hypothetical protein
MLNSPVKSATDPPRPVAVQVLSKTPCPYCGTYHLPEDWEGVDTCPDCGYSDRLVIDENTLSISSEPDPLDEASWLQLLKRVDQEVL